MYTIFLEDRDAPHNIVKHYYTDEYEALAFAEALQADGDYAWVEDQEGNVLFEC